MNNQVQTFPLSQILLMFRTDLQVDITKCQFAVHHVETPVEIPGESLPERFKRNTKKIVELTAQLVAGSEKMTRDIHRMTKAIDDTIEANEKLKKTMSHFTLPEGEEK